MQRLNTNSTKPFSSYWKWSWILFDSKVKCKLLSSKYWLWIKSMRQVVAMIIDYCCWKILPQLAIFHLDYFDNLFQLLTQTSIILIILILIMLIICLIILEKWFISELPTQTSIIPSKSLILLMCWLLLVLIMFNAQACWRCWKYGAFLNNQYMEFNVFF